MSSCSPPPLRTPGTLPPPCPPHTPLLALNRAIPAVCPRHQAATVAGRKGRAAVVLVHGSMPEDAAILPRACFPVFS